MRTWRIISLLNIQYRVEPFWAQSGGKLLERFVTAEEWPPCPVSSTLTQLNNRSMSDNLFCTFCLILWNKNVDLCCYLPHDSNWKTAEVLCLLRPTTAQQPFCTPLPHLLHTCLFMSAEFYSDFCRNMQVLCVCVCAVCMYIWGNFSDGLHVRISGCQLAVSRCACGGLQVMRWTSLPCWGQWPAPGLPAPAVWASSVAPALLAHFPAWPTPTAEPRSRTAETQEGDTKSFWIFEAFFQECLHWFCVRWSIETCYFST